MRARVSFSVAFCAVSVLFAGVALAAALEPGWPLPEPAPIALGFGESYISADGSSSVHRGVDIAAPAGTAVTGVLDGSVTFAGRVPAGDGATTIAVTVESGDVRLTYMPLSEASVVSGEVLAAGARVGTLAASGDRSSADSHLHLGARRGSLYIDPMPFLLAPVAPTGSTVTDPVPVPAVPERAPAVPSATLAPAASPVTATRTQPAPVPGAVVPSPVFAGQSASVDSGVQTAVSSGSLAPAASGDARPEAASTHVGAAGLQPARARSNLAGLMPDAGLSALAVDRRAEAMSRAPAPVAAIVAVAAVLGLALLWPVWRSTPALCAAIAPERQDVAAVVAR